MIIEEILNHNWDYLLLIKLGCRKTVCGCLVWLHQTLHERGKVHFSTSLNTSTSALRHTQALSSDSRDLGQIFQFSSKPAGRKHL